MLNLSENSMRRGVFTRQEPGHNGLHQAAGITAFITAHEPADGVAGGIKPGYRLIVLIERLAFAVD